MVKNKKKRGSSQYTNLKKAKEIFGLVVITLSVLLGVSLLTYNVNDPSFSYVPKEGIAIHNYCGIVGSSAATALLIAFGIGATLIPIFAFGFGLMHFRERTYSIMTLVKFFCPFLLLLAVCSLAQLMFGSLSIKGISFASDSVDGISVMFYIGGILGKYTVDTLLMPYLGYFGSFIVFVAALLISMCVMTNVSLKSVVRVTVLRGFVFFRSLGLICSKVFRFFADMAHSFFSLLFVIRPKRRGRVKSGGKAVTQRESDTSAHASQGKTDLEVEQDWAYVTPPEERRLEQETFFQEVRERDKKGGFCLPSLDLLKLPPRRKVTQSEEEITRNSQLLEATLLDYGIEGKITDVSPGPVITRYEFEPAPGIKISRIASLSDDIAMAMKAYAVRIIAPIPGKSAVGIEMPNAGRETVYLREIIGSTRFQDKKLKLPLALGKDIAGEAYIADLERMPHLLIAGATGSGKSVAINSIICSLVYRLTPNELKFILIDPKRLELGIYSGLPHLYAPVVTDPRKAKNALRWVIDEMDYRYRVLAERKVRNIEQFNSLVEQERGTKSDGEETQEPLPYIAIIIDEFADLMMIAAKDIEDYVTRLAQMARAIGIHLVIATQRPSVDVITGVIKANFPARIAFRVSSKVDSRTIIDTNGAERLLGKGDMLFLPSDGSHLRRLHCPFVTEPEIQKLLAFLKDQSSPEYNEDILKDEGDEGEQIIEGDELDELYHQAVDVVVNSGKASISYLQRHMRIGYNRAARMIELMERQGIVAPSDGVKPRKILLKKDEPRLE